MRLLARDLNEQINSVKRELDSLSALWILRHKTQLKKKIFYINENFFLLDEFVSIFLKTYDPFDRVKSYFSDKSELELVIVNEVVKDKLRDSGKAILDIFLIGEIDKDDFNDFLASVFYGRKIKYAIISVEDFFRRLEFWDKLIKNILTQKGNIYVKDVLKNKRESIDILSLLYREK